MTSFSPFDLNPDQQSPTHKIVVALERISEAYRVLLWQEGKKHALSPIQIQLLIFLLHHPTHQRKVSFLAKEFNMTKATISDSIKTLFNKVLIEKVPDPTDSRSFTLQLTPHGRSIAQSSAGFAEQITKSVSNQPEHSQTALLHSLLDIIHQLNEKEVITPQRMCFNCDHHENRQGKYFCTLLDKTLAPHQVRIDCLEHERSTL